MNSSGISQAYEDFMQNSFKSAVDSSTAASWGGSGYSVELFYDGTYRVLWNNQIGNLYESQGLILSVPSLCDEDWDEDSDLRFYENAEEYMRNTFSEAQTYFPES